MELPDVRIPEGKCGLEVLACLPIRKHGPGLLTRETMGGRGFRRSTGQSLVVGDERPACGIVAGCADRPESIRHAPVEQPAARLANQFVGHVTEPAVAEVVTHVGPGVRIRPPR